MHAIVLTYVANNHLDKYTHSYISDRYLEKLFIFSLFFLPYAAAVRKAFFLLRLLKIPTNVLGANLHKASVF